MNKNNFIFQLIENDLKSGRHNYIRTRFSPEPNGYLHIGHAKSICLNFGIAKKYNGICNLRFDDTNPIREDIKFINAIKDDIKWLGFYWHGDVKYSSDYFDNIYCYAIELINKGLAYVDELDRTDIRNYRGSLQHSGINSPYRNRSISENLLLFEKMKNGFFQEGYACLRAKIDMSSSYMVMRDPVLYRIKYDKHHQLGNKWCIYPTYDFSHCISDAIEGITHSLCTLEFQDNRRLYDWILDNISIQCRPKQYEYSRLNLTYTMLSKRKLNIIIKNKIVENWIDPRLPTIAGLRYRGYTASSIREFCNRIGVTKQNNTIELSLLESCIRNDLNNCAPRVMAVLDPIKVVIENMINDEEIIIIHNHPTNHSLGMRKLFFSKEIYIDKSDFCEYAPLYYNRLTFEQGVRLRNAYIIKVNKIDKDEKGNITTIYCTYNPDTLGNKVFDNDWNVKGVIHWLSIAHSIQAKIKLYDHLFTVKNPDNVDNILNVINKKSLIIKNGFVENNLIHSQPGQIYQFERLGYFSVDISNNPDCLVFNRTIKLKQNWDKKNNSFSN
uniref:Glutamine--tRNA ligase n=1 Tax=Candidatus Aschnera chinzeii TaxID=1485666 RepID=A0AAT9G576_9ENTR|nr:MAG: glutamine--tRNA ligase [Candidatus Aschnera chinzeii]